jgi:transposase, IS5 family
MERTKLGLDPLPKKTRKDVFREEMNAVVPFGNPVSLIQPHARRAHKGLGGGPPFAMVAMLRIQFVQLRAS